jgi:thiol-disulfide isomerase/thioredoxin
MQIPVFFKRALVAISVLAMIMTSLSPAWSQGKGSMVIFAANWCASCREVVPIAREVASQNGLDVVEIDVDSPDAPKRAQSLGMSIPNGEPPQVFYTNRGRTVLLFNGRGYKTGSGAAVRATILQNLQKSL